MVIVMQSKPFFFLSNGFSPPNINFIDLRIAVLPVSEAPQIIFNPGSNVIEDGSLFGPVAVSFSM